MKPETGKTKHSQNQNQVSIQLKLGGHSFSVDTLPASVTEGSESVEFVVLTRKTLLVPRDEFDEAYATTYLRLAGIPCDATQMPVWSDTEAPIVAVMAADTACVTAIGQKLGRRATFTSPLLRSHPYVTPTVWLYRTEQLLYIKVYGSDLRFAEVVAAKTESDIVYYIELLAKEFSLHTHKACIEGTECGVLKKLLRPHFQQIICV